MQSGKDHQTEQLINPLIINKLLINYWLYCVDLIDDELIIQVPVNHV